jgi:predicted translin family RNA/ssDNA-binding protein
LREASGEKERALALKDKAAEEAKTLKEHLAAVEAEWQLRLREASGEKERALALKDKVFEEAKALKEQLAAVEAEWQRRLAEASGELERAAEAHRYHGSIPSAGQLRQSLNSH